MRRFALLVAGLALLAGVAATVSGGATQAEARWVITDLGTLGGPSSRAWDINDRGQILGWAETAQKPSGGWYTRQSFIWENGKMRAISISPYDINERGQVAGSVRLGGHEQAASWENGRTRTLGTLSGKRNWWTESIALNDQGQVIGNDIERLSDGETIWRGFLWEKGKMVDLGNLGRLGHTSVHAINNTGQIIGMSSTHADADVFLWQNGKMTDLGPRFRVDWESSGRAINDRGQIPGQVDGRWAAVWENGVIRSLPRAEGVRSSTALAINEAGTAVGRCTLKVRGKGDRVHPCMWRDGKVYDLGFVYGEHGPAVAINDSGLVIGTSRVFTSEGPSHAFVWQDGMMTDLGTLPGGKSSAAVAINNRGQIIGWSDTKSGASHAVLWTLKR